MDKTIGEVLHELMDFEPADNEWEQAGFDREMLADPSLEYQLNRLSKQELDQTRQYLQVKRASSLRKQELATVLAQAIKLKAPRMLQVIDEITYDYLLELVENRGVLRKANEIFLGTLLFLQQAGLAFTGEMSGVGPVLVMPREVMDVLSPLLRQENTRQLARETQRGLMAMRGVLAHYGAVEATEMPQVLQGMGYEVPAERYSGMVFGVGLANGYFDIHEGYLTDKRLVDRTSLLEEQAVRSQIGYYPLSLKKAVAMGEQLYLDWTEEHRDLFDHLQDEGGLDDEEISEAVAFLLFAMNNSLASPMLLSELARMGVPVGGYRQAAEILTLVEAARRKTRLWVTKGYTPLEAEELERRPRLQVLVNDGERARRESGKGKGSSQSRD